MGHPQFNSVRKPMGWKVGHPPYGSQSKTCLDFSRICSKGMKKNSHTQTNWAFFKAPYQDVTSSFLNLAPLILLNSFMTVDSAGFFP
jgi:hypothetical protein